MNDWQLIGFAYKANFFKIWLALIHISLHNLNLSAGLWYKPCEYICKTLNSNVDAKIRLSAPKSDGLASSLLLERKLKSDGHDSDGNEKMWFCDIALCQHQVFVKSNYHYQIISR